MAEESTASSVMLTQRAETTMEFVERLEAMAGRAHVGEKPARRPRGLQPARDRAFEQAV